MPANRAAPGARRRRNANQPQWRQLPAEGRQGDPPELPGDETDWLDSTREWWKTAWASPMATAWVDADLQGLLRLARLYDIEAAGDLPASAYGEITKLEDRFGLTPKARQQLGWQITEEKPDAAEVVSLADRPKRGGGRRRPRAVESGA